MKKYSQKIENNNNKSIVLHKSGIPGKETPDLEEFSDYIESKSGINRRDFLKVCGFSVATATLVASCKAPVIKAIPFLIKPEEVTSGVANYYASTYYDEGGYCSIIVKTREGRPIKIEGNELSTISRGGTHARVQSSVLSLYDSERLHEPLQKNHEVSWDQIDSLIKSQLTSIDAQEGQIIILSKSIISPSTRNIFKEFLEKYPHTKIVYYDAIPTSGILEANKISFGLQILPDYHFDNAEVVVSFGADFLGNWISPVEFTRQYAEARKPDSKKGMLRHHQFESGMSLTGSNADERYPVKPSDEGIVLANLYNELASLAGNMVYNINLPVSPVDLKAVAKELWKSKGKSLVVSGSNDADNQIIVNAINVMLGNYGNTIDLRHPVYVKQGIISEIDELVNNMRDEKIDALIINDVNPVYDYPDAENFIEGMKNVKLTISLAETLDETASLVDIVCPSPHYLESWDDFEPKKGNYSIAQPMINKLFNSRSPQESLLAWMGEKTEYYEYIKQYWQENIYTGEAGGFDSFWIKCRQDGVYNAELNEPGDKPSQFDFSMVKTSINDIVHSKINMIEQFEVNCYESIGIGNGKQANNPWLQELPDPITKVCWDNYAAISPKDATEMSLATGDVISIITHVSKIELPVIIQQGQAVNTISVALGYGRKNAGKAGNKVGQNAYPLCKVKKGIKIYKENKNQTMALTQTYNLMLGRDIVRETTLDEYLANPASGNEMHKENRDEASSLYKENKHEGYHWGLSIDLNSCTGCGNCIIACQAENNVPVVGKEEVTNRRSMHWLRIDRYYSDSDENPAVYHLPVMCQHCDSAPCENVCPVAATMHSDDGLNHMTYNRCIGTRYCMNNCPYKVRRFNWYAYARPEKSDFFKDIEYERMVLNPDVIVRSRGVVEKCSLCIQRIQEMKLKAKMENRILKGDEIQPACMQSCPAKAISFGNMNEKDSIISKKINDERTYNLLEEVSTLPSVSYLTKVRNKTSKIES